MYDDVPINKISQFCIVFGVTVIFVITITFLSFPQVLKQSYELTCNAGKE